MSATPCLFLSHSGADTEAARELKRRLLASPDAVAAGLRVWLDKDDLTEGFGWQAQLEKAILEDATAFAIHVGANGVENWVERELRLALSRAATSPDFPIIPILAKEAPKRGGSTHAVLPPFARQYHAVSDPLGDPDAFTKLLRAVLSPSASATPIVLDQPFVGLRAMTEMDADRFFGRDEELQSLVGLLKQQSLVAVVADSGAGKSSLVLAGLIPMVRGGALEASGGREPDDRIWHVVQMRPRGDPIEGLKEGVTRAAERLGRTGEQCAALRKRIDVTDPSETAYAIRCDLPVGRTETLLVVDQFEELLTETPPPLRASFVDLLMGLAERNGFRIVLTLRIDYFNLCRSLTRLYEHLTRDEQRAVFRLGWFSDDGIRDAICKPLRLAGHTDTAEQEALIKAIRRDISRRPGDVALLQAALYTSWRKHRTQGMDLVEAYADVGGVPGALAHEAERVRAEGPDDQDALAALMVRLVRLGETVGATRRPVQPSDLGAGQRAWAELLATDKGGRLLLAGETSIEIAHEALINQWPWLQDTINAVAADMRVLDRLIERARRWNTGAQDARHLATGAEREEFAALADRRGDWLSASERHFVSASNRASRRLRRTKQGAVAALGLAAVLLAVFSIVAKFAAEEAEQQAARALAAEDSSRKDRDEAISARNQVLEERSRILARLAQEHIRAGDVGTGLLLALDALPDFPEGSFRPRTPEAEQVLFDALQHLREIKLLPGHGRTWSADVRSTGDLLVTGADDGKAHLWDDAGDHRLTLAGHDGPVKVATFSPDGAHLITAGTTALIWRPGDTEPRFTLKHDALVLSAAFSPKARIVATASDSKVRVFSLDDGKEVVPPLEHGYLVRAMAFDPQGRWLATGSDDGTLRLWDTASGTALRTLPAHPRPVRSIAMDGEGRRAVTTSEDGAARLWGLDASARAPINLVGHRGMVWRASFSPDGRTVATAADDRTIRLWNADTGALQRIFDGHDAGVRTVVFSRDGSHLLSASTDGTARIWTVQGDAPAIVLGGHRTALEGAVYTVDGSRVLTAGSDGTARLWDARPSRDRNGVVLETGTVLSGATFVGNDQVLTADAARTVRLWSTRTGREIGSSADGALEVKEVKANTFAVTDLRNNRPLATLTVPPYPFPGPRWDDGQDGGLDRLWKVVDGDERSAKIRHFAISPDRKQIAGGGASEVAIVQDVETGKQVAVMQGHEHSLHSVTFSPDGWRLLTASSDGTARLWDARTGGLVAVLKGHAGAVLSAAFSPDGRQVVTASMDGTARVWRIFPDTQDLVDHAKNVVPRCLDAEQRKKAGRPDELPRFCGWRGKWPAAP